MSDFSAAYHLRTDNSQDVIDLFKRANLKGFLFQPINGWATFVTEMDGFSPDTSITNFNLGTLLFFSRTNDFLGWSFDIFEGNKLVGKYSISTDEDENLQINNQTDARILSKIADVSKIEILIELLNPVSKEIAYEKGDFEFANIIGLENIEWISFGQIECNVESYEVEKIG